MQLEQNAYLHSINYYAILTQYIKLLYFLSDNTTIVYWMKETNSCFFKNCKRRMENHSSGLNKFYTQHLNGYDNANYIISFFPEFLRELYDWKSTSCFQMKSQLAACASHDYNRNNYYIRSHLDAKQSFLYRVFSTTMNEFKLFTPIFFDK